MHNKGYQTTSWINGMIILGLITGCSTSKEKLLSDQPLETMQAMYEHHVAGAHETFLQQPLRGLHVEPQRLEGEASAVTVRQLDQQFPRLANPDLVIYIWPHHKGEAVIPGYFTKIPLYEKNHFHWPHDGRKSSDATEVSQP